jgi:thiol-disulfide isomerase/thioredoxin
MRSISAIAALILLLPLALWIFGREGSLQLAAQSPTPSHNILADLDIEPSEEKTLAPAFLLRDSDGNVVRLDDLRGKVVLLNFWATWCPPCRLEMPSMEALHNELRSQGLVVLAIAPRESADDVRSFYNEHRLFSCAIGPRRGSLRTLQSMVASDDLRDQ